MEALGAHDAWPMLSGVWLAFNLTVVFCKQVGETKVTGAQSKKTRTSKFCEMLMHDHACPGNVAVSAGLSF